MENKKYRERKKWREIKGVTTERRREWKGREREWLNEGERRERGKRDRKRIYIWRVIDRHGGGERGSDEERHRGREGGGERGEITTKKL